MYAPYLVTFLPAIPYIHRIYIWLWPKLLNCDGCDTRKKDVLDDHRRTKSVARVSGSRKKDVLLTIVGRNQ